MDKIKSPYNVLSKISGLSIDEIRDIAIRVKINRQRLSSCSFHDFIEIKDSSSKGRIPKYICTNCKGTVDSIGKSWYDKGLQHGEKRGSS